VTGKRVLDIGTGCGVLAMNAALKGAKEVIGTEARPSALENARKNISDAQLEGVVRILHNEAFENVLGTFDVIIMNIIFAERPSELPQISELGKESLRLHRRLLAVLPQKLNPGGVVLLGFGSFGEIEILQEILNDQSLDVSVVSEEKFGVNWYAITVKRST
jgi:release factor glutamine methyltransferase